MCCFRALLFFRISITLILHIMKKKEILSLVLKLVVGIACAVGAVFGISVLSSCSAYKQAAASGRTSIVTIDTTNVNHSAGFSVSIKKR